MVAGKVSWFESPWLWGFLLFALTLLVFLPALHAGFIWDDDQYVVDNAALRTLDGLRQIWFVIETEPQYYPLVHTTFWIEYHLWGLNPFGYHLVNLVLHAGAAVLLWRVLARLQLPGAWLAAALFALHPVQVESVAWVTERKNVLSAVCYFGSALAYLRFMELGDAPAQGRRRWLCYLSALVLFMAALLSKTVTCSLPAALLLVSWWKNGRLHWREVLPLVPFFVAGLGLGLLTAWIESHHTGAQGADWALTLGQRILIAGRALWFYADKLVWPVDLTFIYPRWEVKTGIWWQWLFPLAAVAVVGALWLARRRIGRGPLAAVLFFAGTLGPALGFINVYPMRFSFVADHFQYLACAGLFALVAAGITIALGKKSFLKFALCGMLLLTLGVLTWRQCGMYSNIENLWRVTIQRNPNCWMAYNNLGFFLLQKGETDEAVAALKRALKIYPDYPEASNNLGAAMIRAGRLDEAVIDFQKTLAIDPDYASAYYNLGRVMLQKGQLDNAIADYQKALKFNPNDADARYNLGVVLMQKGQLDAAIVQYQKALEINPDFADAHNNFGAALLQKGRTAEAILQFQTATTITPNSAEPYNNLGLALFQAGRFDEAITACQKALALNPDFADAYYNLANALLRTGRMADAVANYEKSLALAPQSIRVQNTLAWVLATCPAASIRNGQRAVELAQSADRLAGGSNPVILATLAAAYAEAGQFPAAVADARLALQLAADQKSYALISTLQMQLGDYEKDIPFRDQSQTNAASLLHQP